MTAILFILLFIFSCGNVDTNTENLKIDPSKTFYWQLQDQVNLSRKEIVYDIDLFDNNETIIKFLKSQGKIVICYMNAGAWESWREDKDDFPPEVIGNPLDGWEGEKWLDIRNPQVLEIMKKRMDLAKEKGCNGIEVDNIDGYLHDTGFNLTYEDQLLYNKNLAIEAKKRGLLIAFKNDGDQVKDLINYFDFAIVESCYKYNECYLYEPFIKENKAVFDVEYNETNFLKACESNFSKIKFYYAPINLNGSFWISCQDLKTL